MREVLLDTETTGLDPKAGHRIVEIGMLEMNNKVLTGNKFHFYLNPDRDMPIEAYRIHGISTEFLQDKPRFSEVAEDFLKFIEGSRLVIHNASFDMKFINHELSLLNKPSIDMSSVVDTLAMARKMFPGARANLDALCKKFKIDNSSRQFHGALLDAELLYEVYVELTGGRQTTFVLKKKEQKQDFSLKIKTVERQRLGIVVIKPSEEEYRQHQLLLQKIPNNIWG
ncbi:MAG: DNA polymerase III subunit epsilon [Pseudomonadota bacterium]